MLSALPVTMAYANTAGESLASDGIDEVVVTAQKRQQNMQDIGLSVSAIGKAGLLALGHQDVTALAGQVPSLQVQQYSPTITVFNIRGVSQNDFSDHQEAPIAFYNDEVYISALGGISGQTFDLERVEILRGPQGTLFGRNATGGLVQIVTAKPTNTLQGFAGVTIGDFGQVATEGAISGPLTDKIRARLSFTTNDHGGTLKNLIGPNLGNSHFYAGRLQVEADVGDRGLFRLKIEGLRNVNEVSGAYSHAAAAPNQDGLGVFVPADQNPFGTCPGCDASGYKNPSNNPFVGSYDHQGLFDRKYWNVTARYEHRFDGAELTSITNYQNLRKRYSEDSDMTPMYLFNYSNYQDMYQVSQEFRLAGKTDRLNWVAGIYGFKTRTNNIYQTDFHLFDMVGDFGAVQVTQSAAAFGQLEYQLSPVFTVIGGARYSYDRKTYDFFHDTNGTLDFNFNQSLFPDLAKETFKNYSGKIEFDIRPVENVLFYLSVNRGTKSGGFGVQAVTPIIPSTIPFDQEVLTNYEGGVKLSTADRKIQVSAALFHYNYHNYQAFAVEGASQFVTNHPAYITGLEMEATLHPVAGMTVTGFLSHLIAHVHDVTLPFGSITDRMMPNAPSLSLGGMFRYQLPVGSGLAAFQTDWKYDSSQYFTVFNSPVDLEPSHLVGNARLSYKTGDDHWEVAGFVNNLTDKQYRIYNLDLSTLLGATQQVFAAPRWFGVSLTYTLN